MRALPSLCAISLICAACESTPRLTPPEFVGSIERLDGDLDELIPEDARIEVLARGFHWAEGPVWIGDGVLFSDIPNNVVHKWSESTGLTDYLRPAGYTGARPRGGELGSNGLALDPSGRLVLCQHGDRRVAIMNAPLDEPRAKFLTLADSYAGKRFNSPNDLVYHSSGALYFTDPPYGLEQSWNDPGKELDFQGVYRLSRDGELTVLTRELRAPNGIGLSPDERTLYVAQSDGEAAIWMAYPVRDDGSIGAGRVFFDATSMVGARKGVPDGLAVDSRGNLFATGPGGVLVIAPDGRHLGTILTGQATANCAFGGPYGRTLFITADMFLLRVRLSTRGIGTGHGANR